jgi:polysaccharide deacetylase 2 family uncharacterized protein YibQ
MSSSGTVVLCLVVIAACIGILALHAERTAAPVKTVPEKQAVVKTVPSGTASVPEKNVPTPVQPPEPKAEGTDKPSSAPAAEPEKHPQSSSDRTGTAAGSEKKHIESAKKTVVPEKKAVSSVNPAKPSSPSVLPSAQYPAIPQAVNHAKLVFVFDDAGQNTAQLEKYVTLPFPVTVAVLPKLARSKQCAARVRKSGNEVMLHQPMQAINLNVKPGPGAVTPDMQISQIESLIKENIAEIGPVAGINNHEGSLISEDETKIGAVMDAARKNGAFYLDSRTTSQTRVSQASMELGIPYYERNVFLDNSKDRAAIVKEIMHGLDIANTKGAVIMIGHVWSADVLPGVLIEMYPLLRNKGYTFTTVTKSGAVIKP